jgi:hypothetical protein
MSESDLERLIGAALRSEKPIKTRSHRNRKERAGTSAFCDFLIPHGMSLAEIAEKIQSQGSVCAIMVY